MKAPTAKGKITQLDRSRSSHRATGPATSYLQTRVRGSRLYEAAFILAIAELTRRLHQAYQHAYDKHAVDWVLPQKPGQIDIPGETERLFQDCLKIVEAHLKEQLANTIRDNNRSNQPLALLIAHAAVESTLGTALVGLGGELGLFQLKPSTARGLGLEKFTNKQLRDDFALNTRLGTTYLQQQVNAFGGDVRSGLGAYKQGAKSVRENGLTPRSQIYADAIQKCAKSIQR